MEKTEVKDKPNEEEMLAQVKAVRAMSLRANCFYEKEIESALVNAAVDLKLAPEPEFNNVDEKQLITMQWDQTFQPWELEKAVRSMIFMGMAVAQKKEDNQRIALISIGRVIESMKYLTSLVGIELEEASKTVGPFV